MATAPPDKIRATKIIIIIIIMTPGVSLPLNFRIMANNKDQVVLPWQEEKGPTYG